MFPDWFTKMFVVLFILITAAAYAGPAADEPVNLGGRVNSPDSDFGPIVTADGDALYFTSDREGGFGGQDIWVSYRKDGEWTEPENLGPAINTKYNEGPDSFTVDEKTMYFTRCDRLEQEGICDIFTATRKDKDGEWKDAKRLPPEINSEYNDANASISYEGKTLYFISDRPLKGDEERDWNIFVAEKDKKGNWKKASPLGAPVNTEGNEIHVLIHPDGQRLYFSSDGHGGHGGTDIFYSTIEDGEFGLPRNMGKPVNTPHDDMYFSLSASGDQAYLASSRAGTLGREDIYVLPLMIEIGPAGGNIMVRGVVFSKNSCDTPATDPDSGQPVYDLASCRQIAGAEVEFYETGGKKPIKTAETGVSGFYQVFLPAGSDYRLEANAEGYKKALTVLHSRGDKPNVVIEVNVFLDEKK